MRRCLLFGGGGHALVVRDIVEQMEGFQLSAIVVDERYMSSVHLQLKDIAVHRAADLPQLLNAGVDHAIVAVGANSERLRIAAELRALGFEAFSALHSRSVLARSSSVGSGAVVAAGAVVGVNSNLGREVILNTSASIDHDCIIEEGVHICPGARLAGGVCVSKGATIGPGATVVNKIHIGAGSVIGAGAVVVENIPDGVVAFGVPAREVRRA